MNPVLVALILAAQAPSQPQPQPLPSGDPPPRELTPGHDLFYEDSRVPTPAARAAIHAFGRCVVGNSRELAARTLRDDFTTQRYRSSLRLLSRNNEGCFRQSGGMRFSHLILAGAMAEALLKESSTPLNTRLARAAASGPTPSFSLTDRVAVCTVRSVPDQVAALFATEPGGAGEDAAVATLVPVMRICAQGSAEIRGTAAGMRAMLATAAFRAIENTTGATPAAATQSRSGN